LRQGSGSHSVNASGPLRFLWTAQVFLCALDRLGRLPGVAPFYVDEPHIVGQMCEGLALKRVRVDFYDETGCRHTVSVEGPLTRDKIGRILDYAELMGGLQSQPAFAPSTRYGRTKLDRIRDLILNKLRHSVFSSYEVRNLYQEFYGEPIPLTTVATYLSRLVDRGLMRRSGSSGRWRYCLAEPAPNPTTQ